MKIKLNAVEFDVLAVPRALRTAIVQQPSIRPGTLREVYTHTRAEGGKIVGPASPQSEALLPNGVSFFIPKPGVTPVEIAEGPSPKCPNVLSRRLARATCARCKMRSIACSAQAAARCR
ncbi:hypothetical protein EIO_2631 [Ketogulonicigenium vulgare Y25]|uniref:hypothetical protein n=1 Tax=Ketogulonicigenium vulgare TaxID=92945 RepID=UPI0001E66F4A|nr:hypothetical protein [Ketogulonicigenium vulgare]ADO43708.1 hypothetical protein EIO_2631 [Ketogulonicigenium vulgare Y25]